MPHAGPTLTTDRLILRPPRREDFEAYAVYAADPIALGPLGGAQSRAVAWRGFLQYAGAWGLGEPSMFMVFEKDGGAFCGRIGPWFPAEWPGPEVGWGLTSSTFGKGYATEAAIASIDYAFDTLGWSEVVHTIAADNAASQAVATRLGSTILRQAMLPDPINKPVDVWGQSRTQWAANRARLAAGAHST